MTINKRFTQLNNSGSNHDLLDAYSGKITSSFEVTGAAYFAGGLSGSLTKLVDGSDYLLAGPYITITTNSLGQIEVSGSAPPSAVSYWDSFVNGVIKAQATSSMVEIPYLSASNGAEISGSAIFAGVGNVTVGSDTIFFVSGAAGNNSSKKAVFGGTVFVSGNIEVPFGTSILSRNSANNGWIGLTQYADGTLLDPTYGNQLLLVGDGEGKTTGVAVLSDNMPIALITGSNQGYFSGSYTFPQGITGSITKVPDGSDYLIAGTGITLTTGANGSITIDSTGGGGGPEYFYSLTNNVVETSGSLYVSESLRALSLSASNGAEISGSAIFAGAGGASVGSDTSFFVSGNVGGMINGSGVAAFGGDVYVSGNMVVSGIFPGYALDVKGWSTFGTSATDKALFNGQVSASYGLEVADITSTTAVSILAPVTASKGLELSGSSTFAAGSTFTFNGNGLFAAGLTGSLQEVSAGVPYLLAGDYITIATNSLGQIEVSASNLPGTEVYWTSDVANNIFTTGSAVISSSLSVNPTGTGRGLLNVGGLDIGPITGSALTTFAGGGYSPSASLDGNILSASYGVWDGVNGAVTVRHELHILGIGYNSAPDNDYQLFSATYLITSFIAESGIQTVKEVTELARYTSGSLAASYDVNFDPDGTIGVTGSTYLSNQPVKWYGQRTKEMSINWFNVRT